MVALSLCFTDMFMFRQIARLDKKQDDSLTAYFEAFTAMCRRVCGRSTEEDIRLQRGRGASFIT